MSSEHPYKKQPSKAFWRSTVEGKNSLSIDEWYQKKWELSNSRISTAGSCFAQHIGRRLRDSGFRYNDVEPAPQALEKECWAENGYGMYSARYGNVYTARQLMQLLMRSTGELKPKDIAWQYKNGFVDPFRPTIEAMPLMSIDEVVHMRERHLNAVAKLFEKTDVFVFTLGLTEAWTSVEDGSVYPLCPGTHGGSFESSKHRFVNYSFPQVKADLEGFIARARQIRNNMKFLLTVSPVPLAATYTKQHVAVASSYSKSVLRAVAGLLEQKYLYVDYFPSYEIIGSHPMRGLFYASDMRTVVNEGVDHVMKSFFSQHKPPSNEKNLGRQKRASGSDEDVHCDEALMAKFSK